jgi:hypothetical protein
LGLCRRVLEEVAPDRSSSAEHSIIYTVSSKPDANGGLRNGGVRTHVCAGTSTAGQAPSLAPPCASREVSPRLSALSQSSSVLTHVARRMLTSHISGRCRLHRRNLPDQAPNEAYSKWHNEAQPAHTADDGPGESTCTSSIALEAPSVAQPRRWRPGDMRLCQYVPSAPGTGCTRKCTLLVLIPMLLHCG